MVELKTLNTGRMKTYSPRNNFRNLILRRVNIVFLKPLSGCHPPPPYSVNCSCKCHGRCLGEKYIKKWTGSVRILWWFLECSPLSFIGDCSDKLQLSSRLTKGMHWECMNLSRMWHTVMAIWKLNYSAEVKVFALPIKQQGNTTKSKLS